jgi:CHAT domain-containing protein
MKKLLLLILWIMPIYLLGQNNLESLLKEAETLKELGKLGQANVKLHAAADIYKKEGKLGLYVKYTAEQGKNLLDNGQGNDAIRVLEALVRESESFSLNNDENLALPHKYLGSVYYDRDDLLNATAYFKTALKIREKANPNSEELFRDYYNLGVIYRNTGNFSASIKHLKKAVELKSINPENSTLSKMYLQLATTYKANHNFNEAEDYLDIAISYAEKKHGINSPELAVFLMEKGSVIMESATSFSSITKAISVLNKSLQYFEKQSKRDNVNYVKCLINLGIANIIGIDPQFNKEDEILAAKRALPFLEKALLETKKSFKNSITEYDVLVQLAAAQAKNRDFLKAEKSIKDAEKIAIDLYGPKHLVFSIIKGVYSENFEYQEKYDEALKMIQEAIVNLTAPTALNNTPDWKLIQEGKVENLNKLKDFVAKKARIYLKKYQAEKNIIDLEMALSHLEYVDKIADKIRADFTAEGGKMIVSDMVIDAYEMAISACLEMSKVKKDVKYKEKAYYYSEKSKALVLLEAFQNSKAAALSGLSEKTINEEEAIRLELSDIKQQIFQLKSRGEGNSEAAKKLEKALFDKKQIYSAFVKKIEKENPEYFKMKFQLKLMDLAETRKLLKKDQALIEYFSGNKSLFIFKITANEFEVFEMQNNQDLAGLVKNFRSATYGYYLDAVEKTDDAFDKYANDFAKYGSELYDRLLKPLGTLPKRLIIVPSGPLSNMPFEPLLMQKPANAKQFKSHRYVGNEYIISYNYSATLLYEMMTRKHEGNRKEFIAFAPSFGADDGDGVTMRNRRFALAPLNYNDKEVNNVRRLLGFGDVYVGKEATEARFRADGSKYKIIHFATHGMANDRDPDFSLLAFTEIADSVENEFLYVSDLYNLKLNADLVVLSACETGLGELRKGEGVISLARGFSYAGAKSIFTTLWSVNDLSTSLIIESFYKYLKEGKDKDEALHLAKLDFLKKADNNKAHPFLWAPYILIGDTAPLEIGGKSYLGYLLLGGGILIIVIAIYLRKSKKRTA